MATRSLKPLTPADTPHFRARVPKVKPAPEVPAPLPAPTPAQITAVTDVLEHTWSSNALLMQTRLTQAIERDDHNAASKWAVAGAISTDKILVLKGRPTDIVGHVHAHRHDLAGVMDKLMGSMKRVGHLRSVTPVTHLTGLADGLAGGPVTSLDQPDLTGYVKPDSASG